MKKISNIDKLNLNYSYSNSFIKIEYFDSKNNTIVINDDEKKNTNFIFGKLVIFNCTLTDILDKLKNIENINLKKKSRYSIKKINVRLFNNSIIKDVYVII
jgi:hypothetical protein